MRSASSSVSWSPSMTASSPLAAPASRMVRSSSVVFPEPGELMRLRATMPRPSNQPRLRAARRSFLARTSASSDDRARRAVLVVVLVVVTVIVVVVVAVDVVRIGHHRAAVVGAPARRTHQTATSTSLIVSCCPPRDGQVGAAARAQRDEVLELDVGTARPAPALARHLDDLEPGALERGARSCTGRSRTTWSRGRPRTACPTTRVTRSTRWPRAVPPPCRRRSG